jgi:hypothetical protein
MEGCVDPRDGGEEEEEEEGKKFCTENRNPVVPSYYICSHSTESTILTHKYRLCGVELQDAEGSGRGLF